MTKSATQAVEVEFDELFETDISEEDYGFIVGPDGELKSIFVPDCRPFKTPKKIQRILKVFGISDPGQFEDSTLH
jgi:hypothetical protein